MLTKKTAAAALCALLTTLSVAACGNDDGFRRDGSQLDMDPDTKISKDLAEVKDAPKRKPGEPLAEQKNVKDVSTDLTKKPTIGKIEGDAPEGLQGSDVVVGDGDEAKDGDSVEVQYLGVLFDGAKEFDTSWKSGNKPFTFTIGQGQVIQGWDQGIPGMKVGGRRVLVIPSDLAYGSQGSPPTIPANAPLVFVVDLKKVTAGK